MRPTLPLLLILALFTAGVLAHSAALPYFEGSDEDLHYAYAEHIRATGTLPDRETALTNATKQVSGHAPLTYLVGAAAAELLNLPRLDDPTTLYDRFGLTRNPWNTPGTLWNRVDNRGYYYRVTAPDAAFTAGVGALRWLSLAWGLIGIVGAYGAACEVLRSRRWALAAAALFAFMPTYIHSASYFNNDISAAALSTLTLWSALRLVRLGLAPGRLLLTGALLGLAGLAKINALAVAPAVVLALLFAWRGAGLPRLVVASLWLALPFALIFGAWALWGAMTYGDPLGTATHSRPGFLFDPPRTLIQLVPELSNAYLSYWARFGLSVYLTPFSYTLFGIVLALSLGGWSLRLMRRKPFGRFSTAQAIILGAAVAAGLVGLLRWMSLYPAIPARLLLPVHAPLMIALAGGLMLLACRLPRAATALRTGAVGITAATGLLAGGLAVHAAYRPAPLPAELPTLSGAPLDFGGAVRLLGWSLPGARLEGDALPVTLCWEALAVPPREPAYTVKLIGADGIAADRTTLFGLGLRPTSAWAAGDRWCETLEIDLAGQSLALGTGYDVVLDLLDANTFAADWPARSADGAAVELASLGRVYRAAGDMRASMPPLQPQDVAFPGLAALRGAAVDGRPAPGETVTLHLLWEVTGETPDDWTQFVHLLGSSAAQSLVDGTPRGGGYPTTVWQRGEWVADEWTFTLPDELAAGTYRIGVGFYRRDTGTRMPLVQDGAAVPDAVAGVVTFTVQGG